MAECKKCGTEITEGLDFCDTCKSTPKKKKSVLKIIVPVVAVVLVAAIVVGSVFLFGNKKEKEKPNIAVYLQGTQLKYTNLDEINPILIQDGYPYVEESYYYNRGISHTDSATFIENGIYFSDANTIVYPLNEDQKDQSYYGHDFVSFNLKESTANPGYKKTERLEKFYSQDRKYVYYTDMQPVGYNEKQKYLQAYNLSKNEIVFTVDGVDELVGVKHDTGEAFYLKEQGSGKKELFKITNDKKETRVDYNIVKSGAFYSSGEGYYFKEDGLYYFNGESSNKVLSCDPYVNSEFATGASVSAIAEGNKLNIVVKDKINVVECVKSAERVLIASNGNTIYYLDNVKSDSFVAGRKTSKYSSNTTDIFTGDLYKLNITDSKVGATVLYDTNVDKLGIELHKDGITYYKNLIDIYNVEDLVFPYYTVGDFYVNKKLVAEKACYVEYKSCNEIYYINDVPLLKNIDAVVIDNEKAADASNTISALWDVYNEIEAAKGFTSGTLKKYDGTQSVVLAEDVHDYYIKDNGQILMLIKYNEETYYSELYLYGENGNTFIDYDVADIIRIG